MLFGRYICAYRAFSTLVLVYSSFGRDFQLVSALRTYQHTFFFSISPVKWILTQKTGGKIKLYEIGKLIFIFFYYPELKMMTFIKLILRSVILQDSQFMWIVLQCAITPGKTTCIFCERTASMLFSQEDLLRCSMIHRYE